MAKQQFIFGVQNNVIRKRMIVPRPKNMKDAIGYGSLLEVANRIARGEASPNVKVVFTAFHTSISPRQKIRQMIAAVMLSVNEKTTSFAVALAAYDYKLQLRIVVAMWRLINRRRANR